MFEQNTQPEGEGMNPTDAEDTTTTESEEEVDSEESAEEVDYKLELERERKKAYELQQRLKKEKAKKDRADLSSPDVPLQANAIQEQVLRAQGMPEDMINVLKTVSEDKGVDLITAQKDDYFLYRKEKFEKEQRDKEAQLGASKGSGAGKPRKDFRTPGLSADEHRKMFNQAMGK